MTRRVKRRYAAERRFKALGLAAVLISLAFLAFLLVTMTVRGAGGFSETFLTASDATDPAMVGVWGALKGSFLTIMVTMALAWRGGGLSPPIPRSVMVTSRKVRNARLISTAAKPSALNRRSAA